uniref:Calponin-homology (CH) domain-containing protein n=1 Tax=Monopterus albus TaxID=43700 RepID=A0A3Q3KDJ1_MONAL
MSDILCRWLNQEVRLSKVVEPKTFAKDFSSGYLIGEVLHKYQLQKDFSMFMKKDTSISRLNNFTRIEPTLRLLGINFDINTAQEVMQEKQGVATRLLYQLYISLEKKKKAELTGTMLEIMQPVASAGLNKKVHDIFSDVRQLHRVVKRDTEVKLQKISQYYEKKFQVQYNRSAMTHPIQHKRQLRVQDEKRMKHFEKLRVSYEKDSDIMPGTWATMVQVPKPPPHTLRLNLKKRLQQQQQRRHHQAQVSEDFEVTGSGTQLTLQSNSKYIQEIRQRLDENAVARKQREKRRDRFLVEQLKAHEAQEEARREEQLVKRLTRQTQQEQRLVAQLLQIRMQKEVIRENRLFREQQYQQRREKDFQEALEREALAQQAKLDCAEEIRKELESFNRIAAERAQRRYQKHFKSCKDILEQIVDLATKVGEYRLITGNLIPEKLMKEWKELLFRGLPLYEPVKGQQPGFEFSTPLDPVDLKKQEILNNQDYDEYSNMVGEWTWPEEAGATKSPPTNNNILGHVVQRLRNIVLPPIIEPSSPSFPHFNLKACVLGKFCSGKTTCLTKIPFLNVSHIQLSPWAVHGGAVGKELGEGNTISNELLVDIIVEAIRQVPAHSGWVLDGFPVNITQAYLLEKALGGSVDVEYGVESRTNLAADPNPPKRPPPPVPVLDLALLLDIPPESVVKRHLNMICNVQCVNCVFVFMWFACSYCLAKTDIAVDTTSNPTDKSLYLAQISHRITAFQDTWPKLETWFGGKQNILVHIDANVDKEELYKMVQSEISEYLCPHWDTMCDSYVNNIKTVMQQLRTQSIVINHHLFNIREEFKHFLGHPDLKQELVSQWQKDFNNIPDDMREDEDTKAELHLRLDELRKRLWDISDKRKEQNKQERTALMCDGWLEDHTAILINHHSTLMQVELDRFQETLCILRVYYLSMYNQVLLEPPSDFACIPLLDTCNIVKLINCGFLKTNMNDILYMYTGVTVLMYTCLYLQLCTSMHMCMCMYMIYIYLLYCILLCPENAVKVRIALVKGHGLVMVHSLHSRAEQTFSSMEKWLEAQYLAEMKSIDQLSQVVCHHIEAGTKLQNELVLECTDFCLNGDCHMVASPVAPPRPPTLEKALRSTPTITQLESLHQQLCNVAPSGLMSSFEFFSLLRDITSVNMGRNSLPEPWLNKNETQLMEIVSLLMEDSELIDWRRFLLSAALPWPFPSLAQLLVVLRRFKAADTGDVGYINEEQYLQTELWFSSENVQTVPEDPSEPLPYDRLTNLHKFFFQLFADHSFSPPRLDYMSMLQYFAADPNPTQGFIRALSVVLGQHLKHSLSDHLVKLCAFKILRGPYLKIHFLGIIINSNIVKLNPPLMHLVHIFRELDYQPEDCVPFSVLSQHPSIQSLMETSTHLQLVVSLCVVCPPTTIFVT